MLGITCSNDGSAEQCSQKHVTFGLQKLVLIWCSTPCWQACENVVCSHNSPPLLPQCIASSPPSIAFIHLHTLPFACLLRFSCSVLRAVLTHIVWWVGQGGEAIRTPGMQHLIKNATPPGKYAVRSSHRRQAVFMPYTNHQLKRVLYTPSCLDIFPPLAKRNSHLCR